jgi:hypothetical protein
MTLSSPLTKEFFQNSTAFISHYTTAVLNPVIQPGHFKTMHTARNCTTFRVMGTEHQPCYPGMHNRTDTHQAGLQSDIEGGIGKPVIAK